MKVQNIKNIDKFFKISTRMNTHSEKISCKKRLFLFDGLEYSRIMKRVKDRG